MPTNLTVSVANRLAQVIREDKDYKLRLSDTSMAHAVENPRHLDDFQTSVKKAFFGPDLMVVNVTQCPDGEGLKVLARKDVYDVVETSVKKLEAELNTSISVERIGYFDAFALS